MILVAVSSPLSLAKVHIINRETKGDLQSRKSSLGEVCSFMMPEAFKNIFMLQCCIFTDRWGRATPRSGNLLWIPRWSSNYSKKISSWKCILQWIILSNDINNLKLKLNCELLVESQCNSRYKAIFNVVRVLLHLFIVKSCLMFGPPISWRDKFSYSLKNEFDSARFCKRVLNYNLKEDKSWGL